MSGENLGLGRIIPEDAVQHRDCIHIAVVPVVAGETLRPGQKVELVRDPMFGDKVHAASGISVGVVDPYLIRPVMKGQRCWLYLNPGSITSLRHDWTHPAFEGVPA